MLIGSIVLATSGSDATASAAPSTRMLHPPAQIAGSVNGVVPSSNWAGYADTDAGGTPFANVSGSWVEPAVTCTGQAMYSAFWIGIDGYLTTSSNTVEQIGTEADCTKASKKVAGGPSYYAWWELFPQPSNNLSTSNYPVSAGDTLTASVTRSGAAFTLTMSDVNTGSPAHSDWTFTAAGVTPTTTAAGSSAEWITEAPSVCKGGTCATGKLADFGIVSFTGATATLTGGAAEDINSSPPFSVHEIDMQKSKKLVKASTSNVTAGTSFNVTWHHD